LKDSADGRPHNREHPNSGPVGLQAVNDIFLMLGIESWKPVIGALLLPPVPFALMVLVGGRLMVRRRLIAWTLLFTGALGIWFMCTVVAGTALTNLLLMPPRSLSPSEIGDLRNAQKTAIVVLGSGSKGLSPEYGVFNLTNLGVERLRYGVWLSRETSLPLAFSGGIGHGGPPGPSEAEIAARIAELEFGHPLRWTETQSRDTNENAMLTLPLLKQQGIEHIVLVAHGSDMRRARAAFERASQRTSIPMKVTPAPMGMGGSYRMDARDWLPSRAGFDMVNIALHEWLGRVGGA
jgi:uncharacterized SAM-binding protein YcdF (DUF218 family)